MWLIVVIQINSLVVLLLFSLDINTFLYIKIVITH